MLLPNIGILSMWITALCAGIALSVEDQAKKRLGKCNKCVATTCTAGMAILFARTGTG